MHCKILWKITLSYELRRFKGWLSETLPIHARKVVFWLIEWCFTSQSRILHFYRDVTSYKRSDCHFDFCSALKGNVQEGSYRATPTVTLGIGLESPPKDLWLSFLIAECLAKEQSLPLLKSWSDPAGIRTPISHIRSKHSINWATAVVILQMTRGLLLQKYSIVNINQITFQAWKSANTTTNSKAILF